MSLYNYKAINEAGKTIKGSMTAANDIDLEIRLNNLGLFLVSYKLSKDSSISFSSAVSIKDLIIFCINIGQLEKAGVPLLDAIGDLRDTAENTKVKNLMSDIYEALKSGSMLSAALSLHPKIFDQVFVGLVEAGERTGKLGEVFDHLADHLKWVNDIKSKIKKATYYPAFLALMMVGIVSLMMLFVIPKLSQFLLSQNFELPIYTKALINVSYAFENFYYLIFGLPILSFTLCKFLAKISYNFSYNLDQFKLNLPFFGPIIRKIEVSRFCRFLAITYKSGIGILDCLDISSSVIKNKVIKESVNQARKSVSEGNSLTTSITQTRQFPHLVIRMIKVGEDSGNLDGTLENVNFFFDREVNDAVNALVASLQPALTVIMGLIMMWISMAVFGPLYNSFSTMKF